MQDSLEVRGSFRLPITREEVERLLADQRRVVLRQTAEGERMMKPVKPAWFGKMPKGITRPRQWVTDIVVTVGVSLFCFGIAYVIFASLRLNP